MKIVKCLSVLIALNLIINNALSIRADIIKDTRGLENINKNSIIYNLPNEILINIFDKLLEERIVRLNQINDIYEFCIEFNKDDLKKLLKPIYSSCQLFNELIKEHYIKKVNNKLIQLKEEFTKEYKSLSKEELDKELLNTLNKYRNFSLNEIEKCARLIISGADINTQDRFNKETTLMKAIKMNYTKIVKLLLKYSNEKNTIDLNIQDKYGYTALMYANQTEIVQLLLECKNTKDPIDLNIKNKYSSTVLFSAAYHNNIEIVKLLLECKNSKDPIDLNIKNEANWTALMCAAELGYIEIVKLLLECKNSKNPIDLNIKDEESNSALTLAMYKGYTKIVKLLNKHSE